MSLYYLILWNQEDTSKTLQQGSCPYAPLDEALRYIFQQDECFRSKLGMEVEYAKSNLKTYKTI